MQDFLASLILSECAYKKMEMDAGGLASTVASYCAMFPPGWVALEAVQGCLDGIPQHYLVASGGDAMYVAFMGTKQPRDLMADAAFLHQPVWAEAAALAADSQSVPAAHSGFLQRARAINIEQLYQLAASRGKRLVLCGHSLGGAVAKLCTLRLLRELPEWPSPRLKCVCFATPAVGNAALADLVQTAGWGSFFKTYFLPEDQVMRLVEFSQIKTAAEAEGGSAVATPRDAAAAAAGAGAPAPGGMRLDGGAPLPSMPTQQQWPSWRAWLGAPAGSPAAAAAVAPTPQQLAAAQPSLFATAASGANGGVGSMSSLDLDAAELAVEAILSPPARQPSSPSSSAQLPPSAMLATPSAPASAQPQGGSQRRASDPGSSVSGIRSDGAELASLAAPAAPSRGAAASSSSSSSAAGSDAPSPQPPFNLGLAFALQRQRAARAFARLALSSRIPLPPQPARFHTFGAQLMLHNDRALPAGAARPPPPTPHSPPSSPGGTTSGRSNGGSDSASGDLSHSVKGLFNYHRMVAHRLRVLNVISDALPVELRAQHAATVRAVMGAGPLGAVKGASRCSASGSSRSRTDAADAAAVAQALGASSEGGGGGTAAGALRGALVAAQRRHHHLGGARAASPPRPPRPLTDSVFPRVALSAVTAHALMPLPGAAADDAAAAAEGSLPAGGRSGEPAAADASMSSTDPATAPARGGLFGGARRQRGGVGSRASAQLVALLLDATGHNLSLVSSMTATLTLFGSNGSGGSGTTSTTLTVPVEVVSVSDGGEAAHAPGVVSVGNGLAGVQQRAAYGLGILAGTFRRFYQGAVAHAGGARHGSQGGGAAAGDAQSRMALRVMVPREAAAALLRAGSQQQQQRGAAAADMPAQQLPGARLVLHVRSHFHTTRADVRVAPFRAAVVGTSAHAASLIQAALTTPAPQPAVLPKGAAAPSRAHAMSAVTAAVAWWGGAPVRVAQAMWARRPVPPPPAAAALSLTAVALAAPMPVPAPREAPPPAGTAAAAKAAAAARAQTATAADDAWDGAGAGSSSLQPASPTSVHSPTALLSPGSNCSAGSAGSAAASSYVAAPAAAAAAAASAATARGDSTASSSGTSSRRASLDSLNSAAWSPCHSLPSSKSQQQQQEQQPSDQHDSPTGLIGGGARSSSQPLPPPRARRAHALQHPFTSLAALLRGAVAGGSGDAAYATAGAAGMLRRRAGSYAAVVVGPAAVAVMGAGRARWGEGAGGVARRLAVPAALWAPATAAASGLLPVWRRYLAWQRAWAAGAAGSAARRRRSSLWLRRSGWRWLANVGWGLALQSPRRLQQQQQQYAAAAAAAEAGAAQQQVAWATPSLARTQSTSAAPPSPAPASTSGVCAPGASADGALPRRAFSFSTLPSATATQPHHAPPVPPALRNPRAAPLRLRSLGSQGVGAPLPPTPSPAHTPIHSASSPLSPLSTRPLALSAAAPAPAAAAAAATAATPALDGSLLLHNVLACAPRASPFVVLRALTSALRRQASASAGAAFGAWWQASPSLPSPPTAAAWGAGSAAAAAAPGAPSSSGASAADGGVAGPARAALPRLAPSLPLLHLYNFLRAIPFFLTQQRAARAAGGGARGGAGDQGLDQDWRMLLVVATALDPPSSLLRGRDFARLSLRASAAGADLLPVLLTSPGVAAGRAEAMRKVLADACGLRHAGDVSVVTLDDDTLAGVGGVGVDGGSVDGGGVDALRAAPGMAGLRRQLAELLHAQHKQQQAAASAASVAPAPRSRL